MIAANTTIEPDTNNAPLEQWHRAVKRLRAAEAARRQLPELVSLIRDFMALGYHPTGLIAVRDQLLEICEDAASDVQAAEESLRESICADTD